ncbi:MAG: UpxY family transcription antiterminator [Bacteroidaceae bacterium]|nr:UpxY family transcription antiterminator [Bacteroidaceae bacterium]
MNEALPSASPNVEQATPTVRNACGGAVPKAHWFAAVVHPRYERICRDQILELGQEAYVASQKDTRIYACRHRREIERIIIPHIVFVHATEHERRLLLKQCPAIQYFLTNRAAAPNALGHRPFAVIPEAQMDTLRFMLYQSDRPVTFSAEPLHAGDHVRVIRGALVGLEGNVLRNPDGTAHVVLTLDLLGSVMVTIPIEDIERIA